jgi:hypothetical protein
MPRRPSMRCCSLQQQAERWTLGAHGVQALADLSIIDVPGLCR